LNGSVRPRRASLRPDGVRTVPTAPGRDPRCGKGVKGHELEEGLRTSMTHHTWCGTPPDLPHIVRSVSRATLAVAMRRRDAQAPAPLSERAEVQRLEGLPTNIYRTEPPNAFYGGGGRF